MNNQDPKTENLIFNLSMLSDVQNLAYESLLRNSSETAYNNQYIEDVTLFFETMRDLIKSNNQET